MMWDPIPTPIPPDHGLWFRFVDGYVRFHYGASWHVTDREEMEFRKEREEARAQEVRVMEEPPPQQPDEHILRVMDDSKNDEGKDEEVTEPMEDEDNNDNDDPKEGSIEDEEEEDEMLDWSSTNTITEEPT